MKNPAGLYALLVGLSLLLFQEPFRALLKLSWADEHYTHLILIPCISAGLIWFRRRQIFVNNSPNPTLGLGLLALGGALYFGSPSVPAWRLTIAGAVLIWIWIAGFILCFGLPAIRSALFPALLLVLFIPLPVTGVEYVEDFLQKASADVTDVIFRISGTPVFREGLRFSLPGVVIEVAPECSGIRSSIALFITTLLLGNLFLNSARMQVALVILALPLLVVKNAIRIATLSWLGAYVSRDFLTGELHHRGGILFLLLALVLFIPMLLGLHRLERSLLSKPLLSGDLGERGAG